MKEVIAVKIISDKHGWVDDAHLTITRNLYVMYSDYTWEVFALRYNGEGRYNEAYPKPFRPQNITDKKMTKKKYISTLKILKSQRGPNTDSSFCANSTFSIIERR
jgi:hypothetical protein